MQNQKPALATLLETGKVPIFIGVTGHRNPRMEENDKIKLDEALDRVFRDLSGKCRHTEFILLTSLAAGADQLVADYARRKGMRYGVVLPMDTDRYFTRRGEDDVPDFQDGDIKTAKELMEDLHCAFVYTMPEGNNSELSGHDEGQLLFMETARFISDNCFAQIALWDGKLDDKTIAGTGATVRDSLHGMTYRVSRFPGITIPETRPIYHIYTPRKNAEHKSYDYQMRRIFPEPLFETGRKWFTLNEAAQSGDKAVSDLFRDKWHKPEDERSKRITAILRSIDLYNGDVEKCAASIVGKEPEDFTVNDAGPRAELCKHTYHAADTLAGKYQTLRKRGALAIIWLAGISYIFLNAFSDLASNPLFLILYLALLGTAGIVWFFVKRRVLHTRFVTYRALAEGMRVQYYWYAAKVSDNNDYAAQAQDHYLRRQTGHVEWIRHAIRAVNLAALTVEDSRSISADAAKIAADRWLGRMDEQDPVTREWHHPTADISKNGQAGYYLSSSLRSRKNLCMPSGVRKHSIPLSKRYRKHRRLRALTYIAMGISLALALGLAVCHVLAPDSAIVTEYSTLIMFVSGAMPVLAMIFREIGDRMGYEEDLDRFVWYYSVFKRAIVQIDELWRYSSLDSAELLKRINAILLDIGKESLVENADWVMLNERRTPQIPAN